MRTTSGACVRRARFAALLGSPIPTKQTVPFVSSRAAATDIISSAEYVFSDTGHLRKSDRHEVLRKVGRATHVAVDPRIEVTAVASDVIPRLVEGVVALGVAVRVGGMGPSRYLADGVYDPCREHDAVLMRLEAVDDLLDGHDRSARREHRLFLHAADSPQHHVAAAIRLLGVDDRDIRRQRGDGGELFAGERAGDGHDRARLADEVGSHVAAEHCERQPRGAGPVPGCHPGVAVLLELERRRPPPLDGVTEPVQGTDTGIAAPREDELAGTTRSDELV